MIIELHTSVVNYLLRKQFFTLPPFVQARFDHTTHMLTSWDSTRGRCYDRNFLRFLPIFGVKNGVFLETNVTYDHIFATTSSGLSKKTAFFRRFFWRKYFKNHNIGPRIRTLLTLPSLLDLLGMRTSPLCFIGHLWIGTREIKKHSGREDDKVRRKNP
jgi:hypothetical protein